MKRIKNPYRCAKCGRYMSALDASDELPEICRSCENKLRAKLTRFALGVILLLWAVIAVAAISWFFPSNANASPFVSEYYVSGVNLDTNERVVGYLTGEIGSPDVGGVVYDRGDKWTVVGVLKDDVFYLRSLCCRYQCMFVREVTANKLRNKLEETK